MATYELWFSSTSTFLEQDGFFDCFYVLLDLGEGRLIFVILYGGKATDG